ncbi:hypothetical protein ALC57_17145 [Trachymyrmex cornetzi]|uniref:Uncharacterized protein n=1 Tax=Trachymyrmex cornetzi TaxID=471704 RepID=A0A195DCA2_9HYME|nr:hypothetical protein ALC57_17145 [Trachymyrmex cornetzi]
MGFSSGFGVGQIGLKDEEDVKADTGRAGARPRGRNPFADCHGQALAIIPADFECNDEVSFTDPQGNLVAHRSAKVSRVLSSSNRLDVRGRPRGKGCTMAERAVLSATPGN